MAASSSGLTGSRGCPRAAAELRRGNGRVTDWQIAPEIGQRDAGDQRRLIGSHCAAARLNASGCFDANRLHSAVSLGSPFIGEILGAISRATSEDDFRGARQFIPCLCYGSANK